MKLKDRSAIITGGSQGIGAAIARRFASEGARVAVVNRHPDRALEIVDFITARGGTARAVPADVRDVGQIDAMVREVIDAFGTVDILVNSAGVFYPTLAGQTSEADYDRMVDINLKGTFFCINAVTPFMKERRSGTILNLASVAGVMGLSGYSVYSATKAAIIYITRSLACELAPHGIRINALAPGNTATPMNEDIRTNPELKEYLDAMEARTPSRHTYSDPEDMAGAALFLASDDSRAMHGACLLMDEGFSAGL